MAPSQVPTSGGASTRSSVKKQKDPDGVKGKVASDSQMMSDGPASYEDMYYAHHPQQPVYDDSHLHGESNNNDEDHEHQRRQQPRRPGRVRSDNGHIHNINLSNSTSSIRMIPEVRYSKPGLTVSQTSVIRDRGGSASLGDTTQVQPGEYYTPNGNNKATGQYQHYPSYSSPNNNDLNNGQNNNNYNNMNGNRMNGGGHPQPHPYNKNGVGGPAHYPPFLKYPQPGATYHFDPQGEYATTLNTTSEQGLDVRGEEVGIVLVVLLLWVGAIILFFNRWGKIRMLEPYQPKFCEAHRPSCPMAEVTAISNHPVCRERAFSKFNLSTEMLAGPNGSPHFVKCNYHGIPSADPAPGFSGLNSTGVAGGLIIPGGGFVSGGSTGMLNNQRSSMMNHYHQHHHSRPRQNSVFVTSPSSQISFYGSDTTLKNSARKTKSAVDLPTLVLTGEFIDNARRNSKHSITQL